MSGHNLEIKDFLVNRYLKSLYKVTVSSGKEVTIVKEMDSIKKYIFAIDNYDKYLQKASLISKIGEEFIFHLKKCLKLSKQTENFLKLLHKNKRLSRIAEICDEFSGFLEKMEGKKTFYIDYAKSFSAVEKKKLQKNLQEVFGGEINCLYSCNPSLIGGITIRFHSKILDYSLKSKLLRLHSAIKGDNYEN
ncbi:MAG: ATP synthase F1 subunit delta [Holosporaceae bacterium]|nr:ATP synthase F1 subunit delta [Holosporaceae bacterium]